MNILAKVVKLVVGPLVAEKLDTYTIMETVHGVTFEGRQDKIRALKEGGECLLRYKPTPEFPYQLEVWIGNDMVGYVPDHRGASIAKMLIERARKGKIIDVARWVRVGGYGNLKFGLRIEIRIQK